MHSIQAYLVYNKSTYLFTPHDELFYTFVCKQQHVTNQNNNKYNRKVGKYIPMYLLHDTYYVFSLPQTNCYNVPRIMYFKLTYAEKFPAVHLLHMLQVPRQVCMYILLCRYIGTLCSGTQTNLPSVTCDIIFFK